MGVNPTLYSVFAIFNHISFNSARKYSTAVSIKNTGDNSNELSKFHEWFVGFSDGESNFSLNITYSEEDQTQIKRVKFEFRIALHIDDISTLELIKDRLQIGNVRKFNGNTMAVFSVTDSAGFFKLFSIFDTFNLKSTKYLDYLDFREAFILYNERDKNLSKEDKNKLKLKIGEIKNKMNTKRTLLNEVMPASLQHKINITKSWLLGLIEGEGSFFISRSRIEPIFSLQMHSNQTFLLEKIQDFLIDDLGFDSYSILRLRKFSNSITVTLDNKGDKVVAILRISNINVINNYLLPYLSSSDFLTKKSQDFEDFKLISSAVYKGSHKVEEIKELILKLSYGMNNYRLTTNMSKKEVVVRFTAEEREILKNTTATIERLKDGRLKDLRTGKIEIKSSQSLYEVIKPLNGGASTESVVVRSNNPEVLILDTLKDTSKILEVDIRKLKKCIDEAMGDWIEIAGYKVRRVPVFLNTKAGSISSSP